MIEKIITIQGIGKFTNYQCSQSTFCNNLKKIVAIYADNASGKTTLASVFKSLGEFTGESITRRKSFIKNAPNMLVNLLLDGKKVEFKNKAWNQAPIKIEVFDADFIEKNVYVITLGNEQNPTELLEIVVGDDAIRLYEEQKNLIEERKRERNRRARTRKNLKKGGLDHKQMIILNNKVNVSSKRSSQISKRLKEIELELVNLTKKYGEKYVDLINDQLSIFAPDLHITKLNKHANKLVYNLKVNDVEIRNDSSSISLRRTLSEGEKNAIAFSFFLARISITNSMSETIIVFDDPINSLDSKRRSATKNKLVSIARKSLQFFLLSHDLSFVRDFSDSFASKDILNLKISNDGKTSYLTEHDIKLETMTGFFRDLYVLHDYLDNRDRSAYRPIDVARCLRPVLEGMLRIKYYKLFNDNMWLGDMLKLIRDSEKSNPLYRQKANYEEMTDINDYSAPFHHEAPTFIQTEVNSGELYSYCRRTLLVIENI